MNEVQPGFSHFAAYLRSTTHRAISLSKSELRRIGSILSIIGGLVFGFGVIKTDSTLLSLGAIFWGIAVVVWLNAKKQVDRPRPLLLDTTQTLVKELQWMEREKSLDSRCHPRAVSLLDQCAKARALVLRGLESESWKERSKNDQWRELRLAAAESAESAMIDAIWTSRFLFRRKGWRKTTFEARCSDPDYGKLAFARLDLIRKELEDLANHVSDEVYSHPLEQSAIRNVLADLQAVHEAKEELDRDVPSMLQE